MRQCLRLVAVLALLVMGTPWVTASSLGLPPLKAEPAAQVELGRKLFFDRRLSVNGSLSCAMCHVPSQGFTSNELRTSVGMEGVSLKRNAPTLLNVAHVKALFLDGRSPSLENQALQPLLHPDEMANPDIATVLRRIRSLPDYKPVLKKALGTHPIQAKHLAGSLSAFQRTLIAADSPFDRWRYGGDPIAITPEAQRGFALFQRQQCVQCHKVGERHALFTDGQFHNIGVQARSQTRRTRDVVVQLLPDQTARLTPDELRRIGVEDAPDRGREEVTGQKSDLRAFRTPSLRNVALTAPYMHDGSLATLEEVLDHYALGGSPNDSAQSALIRPTPLNPLERADLLAFLRALSSPNAQRWAQTLP